MTRKIYYSATERAFLFSDVHGEKMIRVPDPDWTPPLIDVPDYDWQPPMIDAADPNWKRPAVAILDPKWKPGKGQSESERPTIIVPDETANPPIISTPDPKAKRPTVKIPDPDAVPPLVDALNPRFPSDAVDVSASEYTALMEAQAAPNYMLIEPDAKGYPRAVEAPVDRVAGIMRSLRDGLLAASDALVTPDRWEGYSAARRKEIAAYRQTLRDAPKQKGWPRDYVFPEPPK